jgi:hypothetical protein
MEPSIDYEQLCTAIDKADVTTLRSMLKAICRESPGVQKYTLKYLMAFLVGRKRESDAASHDTAPKRQAISRYEKCITCKSTFDVIKNHDTACRTHDGELCRSSSRWLIIL